MNATALAWPNRRNSFHPAWLLVPLPALIRIFYAAGTATELLPATVLHFVLLLACVAPWIWWRSGTAPAFVVQCAKEIRGVMPALLIALLGPAIGGFAGEIDETLLAGFYGFPIGCVLVAVGIFSSEFENRTLATFLGQPRSRAALYRRKLGVLAALLLLATANAALSMAPLPHGDLMSPGEYKVGAALLLLVFVSAPLYGMVTRNTIAGATFTVAVPLGLFTPLYLAQCWYFQRTQGIHEPPDEATLALGLASLAVYCVGCAILGWWKFLRLDATDAAQPTTARGLLKLGRPAEWLAQSTLFRGVRNGPIAGLVRKEIRLQSIPWVAAGIMLAIGLLAGGARALDATSHAFREPSADGGITPDSDRVPIAIAFMGMAAVICLIGTGATCVAEERQLGTHDWQLTQPATLGRQWLVKLSTLLAIGLLAGCVWPLLVLCAALGNDAVVQLFPPDKPLAFLAYPAAAIVLLVVATHASSFSKTTLKAGVSTIGAVLAIGTLVVVLVTNLERHWSDGDFAPYQSIVPGQPVPWAPTPGQAVPILFGMVAVLALAWLAVPLEFARRNHRRSAVAARVVCFQWIAIAAITIAAFAIPMSIVREIDRRMVLRDAVIDYHEKHGALLEIVRAMVAENRLPDGVRAVARVGPAASADELTVALLRERGLAAFDAVKYRVPDRGSSHSPGPILPAVTRYTGVTVPPGNTLRMDPALMRRYGLRPPTNNAKFGPAPKPAK